MPHLLWSNAALAAGWRATLRTHESYLEELRAAGRPLPGPFKVKTLFLEGILADVLHAVDQGLAAHLIANVFVEIMKLRHWGTTQAEQVKGLEAD